MDCAEKNLDPALDMVVLPGSFEVDTEVANNAAEAAREAIEKLAAYYPALAASIERAKAVRAQRQAGEEVSGGNEDPSNEAA